MGNKISNLKSSLSFTGHRIVHNPDQTRQKVREISLELIQKGVTSFLVGGALGFDAISSEEILKIRQTKSGIGLTVVLPCRFEAFTLKWSGEEKQRLKNIMSGATETVVLQENYTQDCYKKRNQYLADNSGYCVCYYDLAKFKSGTGQAVRMAGRNNLTIINLF